MLYVASSLSRRNEANGKRWSGYNCVPFYFTSPQLLRISNHSSIPGLVNMSRATDRNEVLFI